MKTERQNRKKKKDEKVMSPLLHFKWVVYNFLLVSNRI